MSKRKLSLVVCFLTLSSTAKADASWPKDLEKFLWDREGCDHFRGEMPPPSEKRRMQEVQLEIDRLCKGTDERLQRLKKKYADDAGVINLLNGFETNIESDQ